MLNNKDKNFVSILVYVEEHFPYLNSFIYNINKKFENKFINFEILVVNNSEKSLELSSIKNNSSELSNLIVINLIKKYDRDSAMTYCIDKCIGDYIFVFDKFNDSTRFIDNSLEIYQDMLGKYDLVLLKFHNKSLIRKLINNFIKLYSGFDFFLKPIALVILTRKALNRIKSVYKVSIYRNAEYLSSGLITKEIEMDEEFNDRFDPKKISFGIDTLLLYTDVFFKFGTYLIIFFFLTSVSSLIYTLYFYFTNRTIQGWATTMSFMSISFFGVFLTLFLFLRYLNLILRNSLGKNNIIIEKIDRY